MSYLYYTPPEPTRTYTLSMWVKRGQVYPDRNYTLFSTVNTNALEFAQLQFGAYFNEWWDTNGNWQTFNLTVKTDIGRNDIEHNTGTDYYISSRQIFQDKNGWYHFVFQCDNDNNTTKVWCNGELMKDWRVGYEWRNDGDFDDYDDGLLKGIIPIYDTVDSFAIGACHINNNRGRTSFPSQPTSSASFSTDFMHPFYDQFEGQMTDIILSDGLLLTPTNFGQFSNDGLWQATTAQVSSFGDSGFRLQMVDSSDLGKDFSNNMNDFTVSGDLMMSRESPVNVYPSFNSIYHRYETTIVDGGKSIDVQNKPSGYSTNYNVINYSSMALRKGKWYYEVQLPAGSDHGLEFSTGLFSSSYVDTFNHNSHFDQSYLENQSRAPLADISNPARGRSSYNGYMNRSLYYTRNNSIGTEYNSGSVVYDQGFTNYGNNSQNISKYSMIGTDYAKRDITGLGTGGILNFAIDLDDNKFCIGRNGMWLSTNIENNVEYTYRYFRIGIGQNHRNNNDDRLRKLFFLRNGVRLNEDSLTITQTGNPQDDYPVTNLISNIFTTEWRNSATRTVDSRKYVTYDYGSPVTADEFYLASSSDAESPNDWTIEGSNDGTNYATLFRVDNTALGGSSSSSSQHTFFKRGFGYFYQFATPLQSRTMDPEMSIGLNIPPLHELEDNFDGRLTARPHYWLICNFFRHNSSGGQIDYNFGQGMWGDTPITTTFADDSGNGHFAYQPPAGFNAICSKNLETVGVL